MGMIRKTLKENKGVALITVLGVFIIIMIFSLSISTIFASNLKQATQQERQTQAYLLALSGIDLAYEALMKEPADETKGPLLDAFKWDQDRYPDIADDLTHRPVLKDTFKIDEDEVEVTIKADNESSTRVVIINSIGKVTKTGNTQELTLIFEAENPLVRRWQ